MVVSTPMGGCWSTTITKETGLLDGNTSHSSSLTLLPYSSNPELALTTWASPTPLSYPSFSASLCARTRLHWLVMSSSVSAVIGWVLRAGSLGLVAIVTSIVQSRDNTRFCCVSGNSWGGKEAKPFWSRSLIQVTMAHGETVVAS